MKHTKGKVRLTPLAGTQLDCRIKGEKHQIICDCYSFSEGIKEDETKANAELIAESFNVTNESGLTPRQLLDQRNELLDALTAFIDGKERDLKVLTIKAQDAINNAQKATPADKAGN